MRNVDPKIHVSAGSAKCLAARVTGEAGKAVVHFDESALGKETDADGVGAQSESRRKHLLRFQEGLLSFREFFRDSPLPFVSEYKARGGNKERSSDRDPRNGQLFCGNPPPHQ